MDSRLFGVDIYLLALNASAATLAETVGLKRVVFDSEFDMVKSLCA